MEKNNKFCTKCGSEIKSSNGECTNCSSNGVKNKNTPALLGFIFSFFGCFSFIGFIFSIVGLLTSKEYKNKRIGLAVAGLIISSLMLTFTLYYLSSDSQSDSTNNVIETSPSNDSENNEVCVTFRLDGSEYHKECVEKGNTVTKPADPTKDGYNFLNWATHVHSTDGSEVFDFDKPVDESITVFAHFKLIPLPAPKPKFSYVVTAEYSSYFSYYIEGTVTNNRDTNYSYLQIEFICYDSAGNNIGTAFDNTNNLLGNQTWKYKALLYGDESDVDHCVYHDITGW